MFWPSLVDDPEDEFPHDLRARPIFSRTEDGWSRSIRIPASPCCGMWTRTREPR